MGKRKQTVPQKASEEKRKCFSWNMLEDQAGSSMNQPGLTLIDDRDPRLLQELDEAEQIRKKSKQNIVADASSSQTFYANDDVADIFNLLLENCLFYVSVLRKPKLKPREWSCDFGEFQVSFLPEFNVIPVPDELPEIGECWLYAGIQQGKSLLYYEIPDEQEQEEMPQKSKKKKIQNKKRILFWNVDISLSIECMEALKCSVFQVVIVAYDFKSLTIDLKIIATEAALSNLSFVSEPVRPKKQNHAITTLVEQFYGIHPPSHEDLKYSKKHDIDELYREIRQRHLEENRVILPDIQHPSFKPQLRLYQQQAITWMVEKEKNHTKFELDHSKSGQLHLLYTEITSRDNKKLYYNKHGGVLVLKKPCSVLVPPAGILGEEMGLGKTVEVLGCMLNHQRIGVPKPEKLPMIIDDIKKEHGKKTKKKEKKPKRKKDKLKDNEKSTGLENPGPSNPVSFAEEPDSNTGSTINYANYTDNEAGNQLDTNSVSCDTQDDQTKSGREGRAFDDPGPSTSSKDQYRVSPMFQSSERTLIDPICQGEQSQGSVGSFLTKDDIKSSEKETSILTATVSSINQSDGKEASEEKSDKRTGASKSEEELDNKTKLDGKSRLDSLKTEELNLISESTKTVNEKFVKPDGVSKILDEKSLESGRFKNLHKSSVVSDKQQDFSDNGVTENDTDSFDEIKCVLDKDNVSADSTQDENHNMAGNKVMKRKISAISMSETLVDQKPQRNIFTEMPASQRECFECSCGATEPAATKKDAKKHPVQCVNCSLWQHAECVNYDLTDVYRGPFKCPHCHVSSPPVLSGATLIISPASIAHQWVEEILKHVVQESLNVFMYTGVNKQGFIQPQTLAQQDIVITTYETLRKEIDYVDLPHNNSSSGRKLRHPKRFMATPSPITAVEWWRICLDEAQMVECTTTKTAEMALKLSAVNRWCVTGTPIQKGVEDLYGLLLFLGVDPFWVHMWWKKLVFDPFCCGIKKPMHDLLTSVLWRTLKKDVLDQINIPKQTEQIHWLTFSPVEDHFYRRQYKECSKLAMERLSKFTERSTRLSNLDRYTINQLLYPLLRLRQACCHPQAVRGEFLPIHKSTMTMEQLLESLTKKAKLEAEESHRALVAAINGQAGLDIIDQQFIAAVDKYREVLRSVEEHKDQLHTDSLQQLHAMYNLHEILSSKPDGVDPTLRDDQLSTQITDLKDKYMARAIAYVTGTGEALAPLQIDVRSLQHQLKDDSEWWLELIEWVVGRDQQDLLIQKVRDDLLDNRNPEINSIARSIRSVVGLEYIVETHLSNLSAAYEKVLAAMKGLVGPPSVELINKTVECCLRPVGELLKTCPFCKSEELFEAYEAKLFSFVEKGLVVNEGPGTSNQVNTKRQGTWADSEVEKTLKSILSFAKNFRADEELIEFGTTHVKLFDALKKEYKKLRTHWAAVKEHVSSFDELDMATTRLRVRLPDEPKPDTPQPNILEPSELSHHRMKLASDRIVDEAELRKKLGQLLYLKNLEKSQLEGPGGDNPEPCPICQQELGKEWSVMQCGHCFCIDCIRIVVDRYSFGGRHRTVKCAVCRQTSLNGEISYVTTTQEQCTEDEASMRVKGSHSTKVEAVVRCLLKIKRDDPTAKALVFSTWIDVLSVIASALSENGVEHRALYTPGKFQANLSSFKQDEDVTALLLPVHSGANGLNLIEATHVILVEPVLNPAQELQAIGRVHRIGQTKPTQVHRFLIKGTIEQKMQALLESMDVKATTKNAEENALTIGDLASLFTQQVEAQGGDIVEEQQVEAEGQDTAEEQPVEAEGQDTAEEQPVEAESQDTAEEQPVVAQDNDLVEIVTWQVETQSSDSQNEVVLEDIMASVEVCNDDVQESDNVSKQKTDSSTHGDKVNNVNKATEDKKESDYLPNESPGNSDESDYLPNESPGNSDESQHMAESEDEYGRWDNINERYGRYYNYQYERWENESDNSFCSTDRDEFYETVTVDSDSDNKSSVSTFDNHNDRVSDSQDNDTKINFDPGTKTEANVNIGLEESVDSQPDIEVDDIIAMNEVDIVIVQSDSSEPREEDNREAIAEADCLKVETQSADSQNEVELEDIMANVETSNDDLRETDNVS